MVPPRELVEPTQLLSGQGTGTRQLPSRAKAQGYHTKSKAFVQVIWVALGKMNNVEHVPGPGLQ
jgi:hypothetical protein